MIIPDGPSLQKRPHLYLSRKLSYSSPLRDTPVHPANNVNNAPPSPGFPSVLAVASSLASSLRASSSSCCSSGDASAMEDHPSILPQHPHWDISKPPSPFRLCSAPSGRLSFPPASNRVESLRSSVLTANSGIPSTSKTVLEDFLIPRPPASSRCSSSDSFYNDRCMRDSSEDPSLPSSSTFWPSGLVMPDEDDGDAMEEDTTLEHDLARISGNRTVSQQTDFDWTTHADSMISHCQCRFSQIIPPILTLSLLRNPVRIENRPSAHFSPLLHHVLLYKEAAPHIEATQR